MPVNRKTGKTDRRTLTEEELFKFRTEQVGERHAAEVKRGKQPARGSPDGGEPEASVSVPSPLYPLASLGALTLESGGSSAADTPADTPPTLPMPPLPERPASPPSKSSKSSKARRASKRPASKSTSYPSMTAPAQHATAFVVEVPSTSQYLKPAPQPASAPLSGASPASDCESHGAKIAELERRLEEVEKQVAALVPKGSELDT